MCTELAFQSRARHVVGLTLEMPHRTGISEQGKTCAGVAEWQTQQTQNLPRATLYGFKSRHLQYFSMPPGVESPRGFERIKETPKEFLQFLAYPALRTKWK